MAAGEVVVALRGVRKDYHGLRPLRVERLDLHQGESIALLGFDRAAAEVLVSLITGATLPDAGEVDVFGTPTRAITDADMWVRTLDRFGLVSERAVLLDQLTAEQNLAIPLSLELEAMPDAVRAQVHRLAAEVGIGTDELTQPLAALSASARLRVRLGRALALNPRVLLAEHPNAVLAREDLAPFAADFSRIAAHRGVATLVLTADAVFAGASADQVLTVTPATGELKPTGGWRRWSRWLSPRALHRVST